MSAVHISPYAGQWYPGKAAELDALLDRKYACSQERTGIALAPGIGFIVPHAGPVYSGTVAAAVYRTLAAQDARRVVLLAFPHHGLHQGVATPDIDSIATPFGEVRIDRSFQNHFPPADEHCLCDHSFEIQLPFLQKSVPQAAITPLYVGQLNAEQRAAAATVLAKAWEPGTVFLASSDFTHYGREFGHLPFPSDRNVQERLRDLDFEYIEAAASLHPGRFLEAVHRRQGTVCGTGPISLLLEALRRLDGCSIYASTLDYQTSGELTSDWRHCVSYAALAFHRESALRLDPEDAELLLTSAAETLRDLRKTGRREPVPARGGSPSLQAIRGAFVGLHRGDELLGCIGNLGGRRPLREEIAELALSSALEDPRFGPATSGEGPIDIEISLLTPFRRIFSPSEFCVGKHGGYLTLEHRSGLLLPQVAEDRDWTAGDFLRALERKSSLWKGASADPKARLSVFEAQVFSRRNAVA